ncbi:MAG: hypothetical protein V7K38_17085 [Nostoc sp.]
MRCPKSLVGKIDELWLHPNRRCLNHKGIEPSSIEADAIIEYD